MSSVQVPITERLSPSVSEQVPAETGEEINNIENKAAKTIINDRAKISFLFTLVINLIYLDRNPSFLKYISEII